MEPIVGGRPLKRNEPCPCGSGLKYKKCHADPEKTSKAMAVAKKVYELEMKRQIAVALQKRNTNEGEQA